MTYTINLKKNVHMINKHCHIDLKYKLCCIY